MSFFIQEKNKNIITRFMFNLSDPSLEYVSISPEKQKLQSMRIPQQGASTPESESCKPEF